MIGVESQFFLLAPNLYSARPLVRLQLELDASLRFEDLEARCVSDVGLDAALVVRPGVAGLVAALATWLQQQAGHRVTPLIPRTDLALGPKVAVFEWEDAPTGEAAGRTAVDVCRRLALGQPVEQARRTIRRFNRDAKGRAPGAGLRLLLDTARARDIPAIRLQQPPFQRQGVPGSEEIVQFGWGERQVRCQGLLTDRVPEEAVALCADRAALLARLAESGLDAAGQAPDSRMIVIDGQVVAAMDATGHTATADQTTAQAAIRAAQAVGLPLAVVDLASSPKAAAVVNVSPRVGFDGLPDESRAPVVEAFFDWLYPGGSDPRIPLALVTGTNGKTTTCHLLASILKAAGHTVGLVCSVGAWLDGVRVKQGDLSSPWQGLEVLHGRRVSAGVMEVARGGLLKVGLGVTGAAAGGCLRISPDHLGLDGINDEEQMAAVKALVFDGVAGPLVLAADSPWTLAMREKAQGREVLLVTTSQDPGELLASCPEATAVVHLRADPEGERIAVSDRHGSVDVVPVTEVPVTMQGQVAFNVENAVFATAFALALRCAHESIREGLAGFVNDWKTNPGRLCFYSGHPFSVLLDYAHNAAGVTALKDYLDRAFAGVRRIGLIIASERRLDEEVQDYARASAAVFDEFVCTEYDYVSRRPQGAGTALLVGALEEAGIGPARIHAEPMPDEAARMAMDLAGPGDAVIMLGRDDDRAWEIVEKYPERLPAIDKEKP